MTSLDSSRPTSRRLDSVFLPSAQPYRPTATSPEDKTRKRTRNSQGTHSWLFHKRIPYRWMAIAVCAYIVIAPFLPMVGYNIKTISPSISDMLMSPSVTTNESQPNAYPEKSNRLTIDKIGVDGEILEGKSASVLDKGIWHRPGTSTPESVGNTVLTAHRFKYLSGNNTFYHLDKLKPGDTIRITWNNKEYSYTVTTSQIVAPNDVSIERATDRPTLTLYTCTPLWTSKNRLVVQAEISS